MSTTATANAKEAANVSKIALGSCAWSYHDWRGGFYPESMPEAQWLTWYSRYLNAVEVDSTFYHAPSPRTAEHWLASTPEHFTFTAKLPRTITHERRLRECDDLLGAFLDSIEPLRPKLGCVLVQLPPAFKPVHDDDVLRRFVSSLPRDWRFAIEFRSPAWHTPRVVHWLHEHGVAWVWADTEPLSQQSEGAFEWLPQTADFLYVRLMGDPKTRYHKDGSRIHQYRQLMWPREESIENWAVKVRHHLATSQRVFLFASNHFEGNSPLTCQRLAMALGMELPLPRLDQTPLPVGNPQLDLF